MPEHELNAMPMKDEDRTKEDLIKELEWHRNHESYLSREIAEIQDKNHALVEELTNTKRALAYNCEALKASIGWDGFNAG